MKNPVVRLKIRVHMPDGSRPFLDPVFAGNGKLKPLYAIVNGHIEHHPEGVYFLRYLKNEKRVWEAVGEDPQYALIAKIKKEKLLEAKAAGVAVKEDDAEAAAKKITVSKATGEYLDEIKAHKSRKTFLAYSLTIKLFRHSCAKEQMQELDRKDVLAFMAHLRSEGNSPRTVANRVTYLRSFLLNQGVEWPLSKADRPRYAEKIVSAYSVGELQGLMAAADQNEYELFQFFLCTGARDQEVQYATWRDVDLQQKTFAVTEKLDLGFVPKDKEEGVVPIPDSLVNLLRARRQRQPKSRLIFPGPKGDKANEHYLRLLKQIALTAGLNCGHCYNKKGLCCDARSANLKLPLSK